MDVYTIRFVKASLIYLVIGVLMGAYMAFAPNNAYLLIFSHSHINLFGFVGMMIFGVAYHVLPRFRGHPLYSPALAHLHVYLANAGLVLAAVFHIPLAGLGQGIVSPFGIGFVIGAALMALSVLIFFYNMWRTIR